MSGNPAGQKRFLADIQRLLSTLLLRDISDPRIQGVSITRVEAAGRQSLHIWVYHHGEVEAEACIDALNRMAPHFGHELRRALPRRRLPEIRFMWDAAFEKSGEVLQLLQQLNRP